MAERFSDNLEAQALVAALPFVDFVDENHVYFKPIKMADYTVKGIYVNMSDGTLYQTWEEIDKAPHPHVIDDEGDAVWEEYDASLCANTGDVYRAIARWDWLAAVTAALCVAATHTYNDAIHNIPEAITCELCSEAGSHYPDELRIAYFYNRNYTQCHYCHYKCYDKLYVKIKGIKVPENTEDDVPF